MLNMNNMMLVRVEPERFPDLVCLRVTVVATVQHLNGPRCIRYIPATSDASSTRLRNSRILCDEE
jgi:hypothetical protein